MDDRVFSRLALRRRFIQSIAATGAVFGTGLWPRAALSLPPAVQPAVLRGTEFDLEIAPLAVNVLNTAHTATAINGTVPGPELRWREGDTVTLRVTNKLPVWSSIHWHGILLPADMDGVPGLSYRGIAPGETFVYRFPVRQYGTYWYHSHTRFQEQTGLYGPLILERRDGPRFRTDREYVVMLSDWSMQDPEQVFANLKKMSDYYNRNQPTAPLFFSDIREIGFAAALQKRDMWNRMRMNPTDFSDVSDITGRVFVYLLNGNTAADNWTALFRPGERVRLRFINGSATTIFDVRVPGLKLTMIEADGQDIDPVTVDEFRISVAETYDCVVEPQADQAYTIFAQSIGRTGYVRGTLAPRLGIQAEVPPLDRPQWLSMTDMMGAMPMSAMASQGAGASSASSMAGMDNVGMAHDGMKPAASAAMPGMADMEHGNMAGMSAADRFAAERAAAAPNAKVRHARSEYGPNVDMHVDMPRTNLDDPGSNLRGNGRRVLTYADLHSIGGPLDARGAQREIELHLTGHMQRFVWSFDGQKFSESRPIRFRLGERLRIVLVNDTMMTHPIHLHGMWSEVESPDGRFQVRKHTVNVQPAQRVTYLVTADAPGSWAYHCHLLYHMEAGMFREVVVS